MVSLTRNLGKIGKHIKKEDFLVRSPVYINFFVQVVHDTLPNPADLHTWGKIESPLSLLHLKRGPPPICIQWFLEVRCGGHYLW